MGTRPVWSERLASVEREVRAWVGWVEQYRGRLGRMLGDEDHPRAGCRETKLFGCSEIRRGGNSRILTLKAYVD